MKIGDYVRTPRFCNVRISEIFHSEQDAYQAGYVEPTYYKDPSGVKVLGKSIDMYTMKFSAVLPV